MNFLTAVSGLSKVLKMLLLQGSDGIWVYISPCETPVSWHLSCIGTNGSHLLIGRDTNGKRLKINFRQESGIQSFTL